MEPIAASIVGIDRNGRAIVHFAWGYRELPESMAEYFFPNPNPVDQDVALDIARTLKDMFPSVIRVVLDMAV